MQLKSEEKIINGRTYSVTHLPAMESFKLLARLGRVAGPALAKLFEAGLADGGAEQSLEAKVDLANVAQLLFEKLDERETEELITKLCANVIVADEGVQRPMMKGFNLAYAGARLFEVFEVIAFVLEFQFGPTYAALLAARAAQRPAATASPASA